jgi:DNA-binding LytR/AlgR family response regulator
MKLKCAIVDDEFLARQYLTDYIGKIPFLELVGDYNSPLLVVDLIRKGKIDVLFLDIQMPDITGLDFLRTLDKSPLVVFTTAYKDYALESFEFNVVDYLLKPFSFERFLKAVNKVAEIQENTKQVDYNQQVRPMLYDTYLTIRADRKHYKINYDSLIYIEGQKAYVTFYTTNKKVTALASLKDLEDQLPDNQFIRIHKSYIVSIKHIESLEGNLIEINNIQLPVGKSYRKFVEKLFGI